MAIPFLKPVRTVLLIGDEALYVYKVAHNAVKLMDSVPWQTEGFTEVVVDLIRKECGGSPVLILNDMTDQHFKGGQRLPKVGMMDQGSVLKRKLQVSFPNYPIRGALPIKGKDKKAVAGAGVKGSGGLYLFAAVPNSDPVNKTLDAVKLSMVSIAGFVLLPIEASDMVRAMSEKLAGGAKKAAKWAVFIGQHQSGALRQVITRDGQLAMTRMTPVSDPDGNPQAWAQEVSQEFKATVSYLSRFGYSAEEGTDVIVIAGQQAGGALEKLVDIPCSYHTFTSPEAARLLGIKIGVQDESFYADALHVAWSGRKSKFILPMEASDIDKIHKPRQAVAAAMVLLLLGGGYLAWQLASQTQDMMATRSELSTQKSALVQAEAEYDQETARMQALGFDVRLIQGTIATYENFEAGRMKLLPFFKSIGEALGDDLRLDTLQVEQTAGSESNLANTAPAAGAEVPQPTPRLQAHLVLSFPPTIELELGMREINNFERRLKEKLPDYDVAITRQIGRPDYSERLEGVAAVRRAEEIAAEDDFVAELTIKGPRR